MIDNLGNLNFNVNTSKYELNAKTAEEAQKAKEDAKLKEACKGFEAMFLQMMYKEMKKTVPDNELFGDSNSQKILEDMLDTQMIDNMAEAGGVGLADLLYKQLKLDEKALSDMAKRAEAKNQERIAKYGQ